LSRGFIEISERLKKYEEVCFVFFNRGFKHHNLLPFQEFGLTAPPPPVYNIENQEEIVVHFGLRREILIYSSEMDEEEEKGEITSSDYRYRVKEETHLPDGFMLDNETGTISIFLQLNKNERNNQQQEISFEVERCSFLPESNKEGPWSESGTLLKFWPQLPTQPPIPSLLEQENLHANFSKNNSDGLITTFYFQSTNSISIQPIPVYSPNPNKFEFIWSVRRLSSDDGTLGSSGKLEGLSIDHKTGEISGNLIQDMQGGFGSLFLDLQLHSIPIYNDFKVKDPSQKVVTHECIATINEIEEHKINECILSNSISTSQIICINIAPSKLNHYSDMLNSLWFSYFEAMRYRTDPSGFRKNIFKGVQFIKFLLYFMFIF